MIAAHAGHDASGSQPMLVPLILLVVVGAGYVMLAGLRQREARGWSRWRTAGFLTGIALLILALDPLLAPFPTDDFRTHMYQHLLIGMYAPLALVLGAPLTLVLRSVSPQRGRAIVRALRSGPGRFLAHPATALTLNLGGLALLYFTPLYEATTRSATLHHLVHLHFFVAGYVFAYAIAGRDPGPHRPAVPVRLVYIGAAVLGHAVLAQLLYAGVGVQVDVPAQQLHGGASLMYFGGDIAELLLAFALVSTWRPRRGLHSPPNDGRELHSCRRTVVRARRVDLESTTALSYDLAHSMPIGGIRRKLLNHGAHHPPRPRTCGAQ
ncbi:cytochrome c oxidase assembly protein [Rhodococcus rhodnii]|uniref:Copper resistance transporter n=1 Tax=Rhodococcus rhodnii LMG 5362 TaxID=1273125 RepID=R7WMQ7_9NOCA|nr:cytochrome c oxidase assembly protein [Rhodococcus rhodnii]EOM76606.1 copper resistance transporter [Rhodococcus rhodnii LMG 5362]